MKIPNNPIGALMKSVVIISALAGMVSCQKNKNDDPAPIIPEGYWKGYYTATGYPDQLKLRVLVKPGGTARVYDMGLKTDTAALPALSKYDGTWVLSNQTLDVMIYSDGVTLFRGVINPAAETWTGTWIRSGEVKGTISLAK